MQGMIWSPDFQQKNPQVFSILYYSFLVKEMKANFRSISYLKSKLMSSFYPVLSAVPLKLFLWWEQLVSGTNDWHVHISVFDPTDSLAVTSKAGLTAPSMTMELFCGHTVQYGSRSLLVAVGRFGNVTSAEKINSYFILISCNLNNHLWLWLP